MPDTSSPLTLLWLAHIYGARCGRVDTWNVIMATIIMTVPACTRRGRGTRHGEGGHERGTGRLRAVATDQPVPRHDRPGLHLHRGARHPAGPAGPHGTPQHRWFRARRDPGRAARRGMRA